MASTSRQRREKQDTAPQQQPSQEEQRLGVFYSEFTVRNEDGDRSLELEAMVDTGASFTIIPSILLQSIGIRPHRTVSMKLADGRPVEYPLGRAWITLGSETEIALVAFGDDNAQPLLGAHTLETFALAADPFNGRLVPANLWA